MNLPATGYRQRVRRMSRRLAVLRRAWMLLALAEIAAVLQVWLFLARHPEAWRLYGVTLAVFLLLLDGAPLIGLLRTPKPVAVVRPGENRWIIGRYSEAEVHALVQAVAARIPASLRRIEVRIDPSRGSLAWTFLLPGRAARRVVSITSGTLYYLDREELSALILHELGHHLLAHRCDIPGGTLLLDVALHGLLFRLFCLLPAPVFSLLLLFAVRTAVIAILGRLVGSTLRAREHLADVFAADRAGELAVINGLLKMGEDAELTEVVLERAASRLVWSTAVDMGDLIRAFEESRPYGRIFQANLFRHADEVYQRLRMKAEAQRITRREARKKKPRNPGFQLLKDIRNKEKGARIRWRRFDSNEDGRLSRDEIGALLRELRRGDGRILFRNWSELNPTTHPSIRDRILLLAERLEDADTPI